MSRKKRKKKTFESQKKEKNDAKTRARRHFMYLGRIYDFQNEYKELCMYRDKKKWHRLLVNEDTQPNLHEMFMQAVSKKGKFRSVNQPQITSEQINTVHHIRK